MLLNPSGEQVHASLGPVSIGPVVAEQCGWTAQELTRILGGDRERGL